MNLHQLKIFYETAQNENLSKTAEKYLIPTSSVSASIKRLEDELNVKLLSEQQTKLNLLKKERRLQTNYISRLQELKTELINFQAALKR